jgi:hypothetical protein
MKAVVALLLAVFISLASASLCEACIKTSVLLQNTLIALAPEKPAREVVQAVCERQCTFSIMKMNQNNYARRSVWS